MSRNLLPELTGTNIPQAAPGQWKRLSAPEGLLQLEFGDIDDTAVRRRIQSIPNPWARMLLFKHAIQDERHPARFMVETELLDSFEYLWTRSTMEPAALEFERISLMSIPETGQHAGSPRAEGFARALVQLRPDEAAKFEFTLVRRQNQPLLASSPFTGLFSAEDAADAVGGRYFQFAQTGEHRPLRSRPPAFQRYMAEVVLPQLESAAPAAGRQSTHWTALRQVLGGWLARQASQAGLTRGAADNFRRAASGMNLEPIDVDFAGLLLFEQSRTATPARESPWAVKSRHTFEQMPVVLEPQEFDGLYFDGAPSVDLPADLATRPRDVLPGLGIQYPWVLPAEDWLTRKVLLFNEPLERDNLIGPDSYTWAGGQGDALSSFRITLPLTAAFFRYFDPDDVEGMLKISASPSRIEVRLQVPVGDGQSRVTVRRTYGEGDIIRGGPELAAWPAFVDPVWQHNVLFRMDATPATAQNFELRALETGGRVVDATPVRRTPLVHTYALDAAPRILEFRSRLEDHRSLGTLLPRLQPPEKPTGRKWSVGVDFGTSNTVVAVRADGDATPSMFGTSDLTLALTRLGESTAAHLDAYFLPDELPAAPFGTALVYLKALPGLSIEEEPLAARMSVPFHGHVYRDRDNAVAGDLKWSAQPQAFFRSAAFLRHVVAVVLAEAIRRGVKPADVRFTWAYPRAFTGEQRRQLQNLWDEVMTSFSELGLGRDSIEGWVDESQAGLRHFFNAGIVTTAGTSAAVLDIGGGTTDVASYGAGSVIAYDSVMLGGRNLTGPRLQKISGELDELNPFVAKFVAWAEANGLPEVQQEFVRAYLDSNQLHLAFSYLIQTDWFGQPQTRLFHATPEFQDFQRVVLYFFAGLFYYFGLSFRNHVADGGELPRTVVLAGNGSRYIDWLTGLHRDGERSLFRGVLGRIALRAACLEGGDPPRITVSEKPKEEVARGLVADVPPAEQVTERTTMTPVAGEAICFGQPPREFGASDRLADDDLLQADDINRMKWLGDVLEIERFHQALVAEVPALAPEGGAWQHAAQQYREWTSISAGDLRSAIAGRMLYLAQAEKGFAGSVFITGLAEMIERMLQRIR